MLAADVVASAPKRRGRARRCLRLPARLAVLSCVGILSGCTGGGDLPPVFNAVFGLRNARAVPHEVGTIPERQVSARDHLIGGAANDPGSCIYNDTAGRRFKAACPDGYEIP
ncbi:hypothetical protein SAMN05428963_103194 [Consotaella salsifontis]|uniref:Uncharacterized protein n=1 Tax=Consotaella salsifontis TaxID=1365950 RepID=A0A1T4NU21_9HYPH|nr:hypothetical protein SAMN05428963_103194 [Consotaella salsifontis]